MPLFLYPKVGLAVFESFVPGNAYYTFRYYDCDMLINQITSLSKTEMVLSSDFLGRGYHVQDKDKLQDKIDALFNENPEDEWQE